MIQRQRYGCGGTRLGNHIGGESFSAWFKACGQGVLSCSETVVVKPRHSGFFFDRQSQGQALDFIVVRIDARITQARNIQAGVGASGWGNALVKAY